MFRHFYFSQSKRNLNFKIFVNAYFQNKNPTDFSVGFFKFLVFFLLKKYRVHYRGNIRSVIIIGSKQNTAELVKYFTQNPYLGYVIIKHFDVKKDKTLSIQNIFEFISEKKIEEPVVESATTPTVTPVQENKYVPISEGWKASETAKGDITAAQKADIDCMIESWKSGTMSDTELKEKIVAYLEEQGIEYMEVSVTSKGYALYDVLPEVDLRDGGNLYSFVGTYSTGKQNPDGTNKTVCYNWSAFVF